MAKTKVDQEVKKYNPAIVEAKWQKYWQDNNTYHPDLDSAKKPFYNLMMFPYPSAEGLHVGSFFTFGGVDVYGRFKRMQGYDVFEPIGLDGFGIHSENFAIKVGRSPKEHAKISEENFYRQLHMLGNSFDWSRTVETYDPAYYKWTQWIFIQLFKAGLAYRKKASVNFCPSCKTVLADEQVISGKCERCSTEVVKKDLEQWFFKITDYAERLLNNIDKLDWTEQIKTAQRQWIGRSEGASVRFKIKDSNEDMEVFTTRPDTLFGATFMVLAPEHPLSKQVGEKNIEVKEYIQRSQKISEQDRIAEGKEKTGVNTGLLAINPVDNEEIPVWVADYVLMGYGTGAIMAVPAHDTRDFEFAQKYNLPIKFVIKPIKGEFDQEKPYIGSGEVINSGKDWEDYYVPDAIPRMIEDLEKKGIGKKQVQYHLRDWLISRQRYWGPPIPLVFCENCAQEIKNQPIRQAQGKQSKIKNEEGFNKGEIGNPGWTAIKDENLPVLLPEVKDWKPKGDGKSPLAGIESFVNVKCPNCGGPAKRETDVSDTFLDSAWYFFRYISTDYKNAFVNKERVEKWLPVNMYIGGAEHAVLHLMYSRFITMVLYDLKLIPFEEPFAKFRTNGLIIKDGAKMSKSKGNVINPDEYVKKFGADSLRLYLAFVGPFTQGGDFRDTGIEGMYRFVKRVWTLSAQISNLKSQISDEALKMMHKTIKKVTEDLEELRYNTAIASIMEYYNFLVKEQTISKDEIKTLILLISPLAPHVSEELWEIIGEENSVHKANWPKFEEKYLVEQTSNIILQINGKVRDVFEVKNPDIGNKQLVEDTARQSKKAEKYMINSPIQQVIYVPGKVINFVIKDGNESIS